MKDDINMVFEQDPAAKTTFEVVTSYAGLHAIWSHLIVKLLTSIRSFILFNYKDTKVHSIIAVMYSQQPHTLLTLPIIY